MWNEVTQTVYSNLFDFALKGVLISVLWSLVAYILLDPLFEWLWQEHDKNLFWLLTIICIAPEVIFTVLLILVL